MNECMHVHGRYPKIVVTDNAREFIDKDITTDCEEKGVKLQPIVPYNPQENSINERIHQTIYEAALAALSHSQLSSKNWDAAVLDATFKYNNLPHSSKKQIPHNSWYNTETTLKFFLPFAKYGTVLNWAINGNSTNKLSSRSEAVQYLYLLDQEHLQVINLHSGRKQKNRAADFKAYNKKLDPPSITTHIPKAFKTKSAA